MTTRRENALDFRRTCGRWRKTNTQLVHEYIIRYGSITASEAFTAFRCDDIERCIENLKAMGKPVRKIAGTYEGFYVETVWLYEKGEKNVQGSA